MGLLGDSWTAGGANGRKKKFKIDRNCQKLMIKRTVTNRQLNGKILTNCPEVVTIENNTNSNKRQGIGSDIELGYFSVYAQWGEGVIAERRIDTVATAWLPVTLGPSAFAVGSSDNFYLVVDEAIVGATYEVYAIESPTIGTTYWEYLKGSVLAGDHNKDLDLDAASAIILPSNSGIKRLSVTWATTEGDKVQDYTLEELLFENAKANDLEILSTYADGTAPGTIVSTASFGSMSSELVVLALGHIKHVRFETNGQQVDYVTITERTRF